MSSKMEESDGSGQKGRKLLEASFLVNKEGCGPGFPKVQMSGVIGCGTGRIAGIRGLGGTSGNLLWMGRFCLCAQCLPKWAGRGAFLCPGMTSTAPTRAPGPLQSHWSVPCSTQSTGRDGVDWEPQPCSLRS